MFTYLHIYLQGAAHLAHRSSRPSAPTARHRQSRDVNSCISSCRTASSPNCARCREYLIDLF